ncbi:hypothetical protein GOBAR_AA13340 [Gossypium barbadense]|uniref:Uncharacterized protein n=1 Tax=Gossypium barbadense TaxID=3634 RepID=A0A2P5XVM1_GOSBA|nr:hypothetical protein GOBAR_AA13340 [Gossypium barbadense]
MYRAVCGRAWTVEGIGSVGWMLLLWRGRDVGGLESWCEARMVGSYKLFLQDLVFFAMQAAHEDWSEFGCIIHEGKDLVGDRNISVQWIR